MKNTKISVKNLNLYYGKNHALKCKLRRRPDSFAEQNGRGAERADTLAL